MTRPLRLLPMVERGVGQSRANITRRGCTCNRHHFAQNFQIGLAGLDVVQKNGEMRIVCGLSQDKKTWRAL